jgi:ribosomal protein L17
MRMSRAKESRRHADHCVELANQAKTAEDRERWLRMSEFWTQRAKDGDTPEIALDLIKV